MPVLYESAAGGEVVALQQRLQDIGFNPGRVDGHFGPATKAAVLAFQHSAGLVADGVAGPRTLSALGLASDARLPSVLPSLTLALVTTLFPHAHLQHLKANIPLVLQALEEHELTDRVMVLLAFATIRAEAEDCVPCSESPTCWNTSPGGHHFDLDDYRRDFGNRERGDGERFKGRGFVQLTGRTAYQRYSAALGLGAQLVENPDLANEPTIAARLLASFLHRRERELKEALLAKDFKSARALVNGRQQGLESFQEVIRLGTVLLTAHAVIRRVTSQAQTELHPYAYAAS